jgi:hypothetical protein
MVFTTMPVPRTTRPRMPPPLSARGIRGTGRDAAALAAMGRRMVAVERTIAFRDRAALLHPSPRIENAIVAYRPAGSNNSIGLPSGSSI